MNGLTRLSLKNGVAVVILCLLVLGYGVYATTQIKQQTFPNIELPAVFVQAIQPGASTEEIESGITSQLEDSLKSIQGYDSLTSTSTENAANIIIQFPFGSDMKKKTTDVEAAVNKVKLPDREEHNVQRLSLDGDPNFKAAVFSKGENAAAMQKKLEMEIVPKLKRLAGVSSVELTGTSTETLSIVVDKSKAAERGISLGAIQSELEEQNYALSLGSVTQDKTTIPIRLTGQVTARKQLENLRIHPAQDGPGSGSGPKSEPEANAPVTLLSDIATITSETKHDQIARFDGEPSLILGVFNTQDANTAEVSDAVKETLANYKSQGIDFHVISDQGEEIKESVSGLVREGLYGTLFCVLIIFLFLRNVRATIISIVSLPISIFATIAIMNQMGYTLNIMTLGGIAVSIGRIVDDSIVVIENMYRWKKENGDQLKGKELAYKATHEVISAVGSSTVEASKTRLRPILMTAFATMLALLPLALSDSTTSLISGGLAITVIGGLFTSTLLTLVVLPVIYELAWKKRKVKLEETF
ncbi:efflux RND transporter permease subunit [Paenibacillus qinlingensis]|uniref:Multidrug efflux pump subunit AcrB n=1 Tax=Paenibacillus qinlingensis TaxID=1837343 RepID=A0ABU1NZX7_9BACL|nr:efflux RND transporter permease subunit [Paenibacillus qinlingensis]MDR6552397.1 multidrug efflux pump subunit AcrB [Paenibacillus qinlingensis]